MVSFEKVTFLRPERSNYSYTRVEKAIKVTSTKTIDLSERDPETGPTGGPPGPPGAPGAAPGTEPEEDVLHEVSAPEASS